MATVTILRRWPDGDELAVEIEVDDSYPDVVAEARSACLSAYAAALGVTLADTNADDE